MDFSHLYSLHLWGDPYFGKNEKGHVVIRPEGKEEGDLFELVESLVARGIEPPILVRFNGILRHRIELLEGAFKKAIKELGYGNRYKIAYPVKVNPERHVVEEMQKKGVGLEVGSKPELLAVMALGESFLLCNGYKDQEYIELALMAQKVGRRVIIIVEQLYEIGMVLEGAAKLGIEPEIGFRIKLSTKGSGEWAETGGEKAKFGLSAPEIEKGLEQLQEKGKLSCLKLLHYHMGSQVTDLEALKRSIQEGVRYYIEIRKRCPELEILDAGGGLAVNYDGNAFYTLEDYASVIVSTVQEACRKYHEKEPMLITESGRAIAAYHSILIGEVIDVGDASRPIHKEALELFMSGKMTLKERAEKESILGFKNYFCNFSVFQSLPDSWGIHQLFPIIPIHRLNEKPENKARIVDITCDSYGKIDNFVGKERDYIWLHDYPPGPYYLGIFLVGAYQEIMGGLHNLFGDTNVVHVELQDGKWKILQVIEGDTIEEVLRYAHYETDRLNETFRSWIEKSLSQGQITAEESAVLQKSFKRAMESYTYLTV